VMKASKSRSADRTTKFQRQRNDDGNKSPLKKKQMISAKAVIVSLGFILVLFYMNFDFKSPSNPLQIPTPLEASPQPELPPKKQVKETKPQSYTYKIVERFPHDPSAFTQGLEFYEGQLYEGTGLNGKSNLRLVDLPTGKVIKQVALEYKYFGEGITIIGDKIYQLTWKNKIGFIYDRTTFDLIKTWSYNTEGWGLTHDENSLIVSDGSEYIYFYDIQNPERLVRKITVIDNGIKLKKLNELEYIDGEIYANIWYRDQIVRIDPETGRVTAWLDFSRLEGGKNHDVLNGIAYDQINKKFYVTGKLWSYLYQVELISS